MEWRRRFFEKLQLHRRGRFGTLSRHGTTVEKQSQAQSPQSVQQTPARAPDGFQENGIQVRVPLKGAMAEWLGSGLQIPLQRFNSASHLHFYGLERLSRRGEGRNPFFMP